MQTSAPTVTAFRSLAASVPGVNNALRTRGASSAMAKGTAAGQAVDLIGLVARFGENGSPITIQSGSRPVRRCEPAHLDRQADGRDFTQRRVTVRGEHRPLPQLLEVEGGLHRSHGRDGHLAPQQPDPVLGRLPAKLVSQDRDQWLPVFSPSFER